MTLRGDSEMRERAKQWLTDQPRCVGYDGKCDGDLEGEPHEDRCPMKGKRPINLVDAYVAGWQASTPSPEKLEECARTLFKFAVSDDDKEFTVENIAGVLREHLGGGTE